MAFVAVEAFDVERAVRSALPDGAPAVLAVSGGLDSMVLMTAASRLPGRYRRVITVATFNHRTGKAAGLAAAFVAKRASGLGFLCVAGRASSVGTREEEWRRGRWEFLREVATRRGATVVTAHTLDDQVETVFMRILRDAGPRGLAALYADSDVSRPFLSIRRETLAAYALEHDVQFVQDPSNSDRRHLRNRIRLDILPSITRRNPNFPSELLELARESAKWRRLLEDVAGTVDARSEQDGAFRISRRSLEGYDADSLRVLWPALAARASVVMDRRGTHRAAEFTIRGVTGGAIQLSGGVEIVMRRDHLLLRRMPDAGRTRLTRSGHRQRPEMRG